jgi:protease-4
MQYSKFFDEILSSQIVATESALAKYIPYLTAHKNGTILEFPEAEKLKLGFFDALTKSPYNKEAEDKKSGVAIVPMHGMLSKSGSWWDIGTDEIADTLFELYADDSIKAIVLDFDSAGGTTDSVIPMEHAIAKRNKPVISAVNASCYSASNYISCLTDKIFAVHRMAGIGSIGIMAVIYNDDKYYANLGIKILEIYPPESNFKNQPSREAKAGKPKLFQDEILSPWAIHFQNTVKLNRKKLDLTVEGILNGRTFYAYDAVTNGLIDGIKPMDEILLYAFDYSSRIKFETL